MIDFLLDNSYAICNTAMVLIILVAVIAYLFKNDYFKD